MAFDLVNYLKDQIKIQKPSLLDHLETKEKHHILQLLNALVLGRLVWSWSQDQHSEFQKLLKNNTANPHDFIHHFITPVHENTQLTKDQAKLALEEILDVHTNELYQLEVTGQYGEIGLTNLIKAQIEYLAGEADDWVWLTNNLTELKGSKIIVTEDISLTHSNLELTQMVQQSHSHDEQVEETVIVPCWAKIVEPIVALAILWILWNALCTVFA